MCIFMCSIYVFLRVTSESITPFIGFNKEVMYRINGGVQKNRQSNWDQTKQNGFVNDTDWTIHIWIFLDGGPRQSMCKCQRPGRTVKV